jgi:8-oxo-dGTP diphosphatase
MTITWQESAAVAIVLLALGYVAWRVVRFVRRKGMPDCRCCQSCSGESAEKVLVMLDAPKRAIPDDPGRRGVVGVVVRDGRMLVIRRSRSVVAPLVYCFPGGGIEGDESEEEALVREFLEELGVAVQPVRRLWQCVTAWKVELAWWLAEMAPGATPTPNPREVESIHWYTPKEMARLPDLLESNRAFLEFVQESHVLLGEE